MEIYSKMLSAEILPIMLSITRCLNVYFMRMVKVKCGFLYQLYFEKKNEYLSLDLTDQQSNHPLTNFTENSP